MDYMQKAADILSQMSDEFDIDVNDGTEGTKEVIAQTITRNEPYCPCCGMKLNIIDTLENEFGDDLVVVDESYLTENKLSQYLIDRCETIANNIINCEMIDSEPELDWEGNITDEYNERFKYLQSDIKNVIKREAIRLASELKDEGMEIDSWYCEQNIIDCIKSINK